MRTPEHVACPEMLPGTVMAANALYARSVRTLLLVMACAMAGCKSDSPSGGTGPTPPVPPTPPVVSGIPTASFTAAATANAFDPVTFDATASTSTDGSALQYVWDFGNGQRGGGKTITRSFGSGGARSVTLTVFDGANRSASASKSIAIAAPPAPVSMLSVQGIVKALDGSPLVGVTIAQVGGTASGATDSTGKARLMLGSGSPLMLRFKKTGYADQLLSLMLPATTGSDAAFEVAMRTRDAALTLGDAAAGGSLTGRDGALLSLPPNALVNSAGGTVTGAVQIAITPVDVTQNAAGGFPGGFTGLAQNGIATPIVSFGTTEYVLTAGGQSVQVAPGKSATIELPLYATKRLNGTILAVGDTTPLWSLDESTGAWVQEGRGTVVESANSPSGLALRAAVTHFSWWNSDIGFDPYGPQPKCVYDTDSGVPGGNDAFATATICNMLAQLDQSSGGPAPRVIATALRSAGAVLPPQVAAFASRSTVPIGGGVRVVVPANVNVLLKATALNNTWGGSLIVSGPVGAQEEVLIKMRPLFTIAGPTAEAITLPFDGTRAVLGIQQTARFTFAGVANKFARIQLSPVAGSLLTGSVRLLQGTTVVASAPVLSGMAQMIGAVNANATYTLEVAGDAAAFRMQADLIGSVQTEPLVLPLDITRTIAAYVTFNGTLTVSAPTTIYLARQLLAGQADLRVLATNGTALLDGASLPDATRGASLTLPAAGTYTVEIRPRIPGSFTNVRVTAEQTLWAQTAPPIANASTPGGLLDLADAQADRNGKVVVAYTERVGNASRLKLQRWTGTVWEAVAPDLVIGQACTGSGNVTAVAFDNANNPVVLFGNANFPSESTFVSARRFSGGTWQALGPNNGTLPSRNAAGNSSGACSTFPALAIGSDGAPIAAYQSDNNTVVQRFDGTRWKGLVTADSTGDVFSLQNLAADLKVDVTGRVWLVTASRSGGSPLVRRFNAATTVWETIGGPLPQTTTSGLTTPRLRFDAAGLPVIAWLAAVGTGGASSPGTALYRYDGSAWSTTGGYQAGGNQASHGPNDLGFAIVNGEALVSWTSNRRNLGNGVIVQRNTSSGWTPIGEGLGEIAQFTPGVVNDVQSNSSKLVPIGGELYLVLVGSQVVNGTTSQSRVVLLRKAAN